MYYSKGHKLLTRESWSWMSLNRSKKEKEPHTILCVVKEIEQPSGELQDIITYWNELMADYGSEYDRINLEEVRINRGCGDYDHKWYIVGERKETAEELSLRLADIKKAEDELQAAELAKQKAKEEKEYKEFLKLQEKFKGKS